MVYIFYICNYYSCLWCIINPINGAVLLSKTVGIIIVIYASLDIADSIFIRTKSKKVPNSIVEITEVK